MKSHVNIETFLILTVDCDYDVKKALQGIFIKQEGNVICAVLVQQH